ncbi:hypothetical protein [Pseudonocardia dioxanivorans]|uniref:hypothetical protein n=1 Tax=Pseudonocardia dioxanivorans TaxID=240495 RepID=UPI0002D52A1E|nr:hypothetical protein [Pseudonocardia dioxanivorans]
MSSPALPLLGVERPRVELRPVAVDTLGPLAAELGERAGIVLEPWQRDGLDMLMSIRDDGKWACYEYGEICSRRNGKTAMFLVRALAGLLMLGETPILWTAQEVKTSMRAWRDFRAMLWKLGERVNDNLVDLGGGVLVRINASNGKEGFERVDNGQELKMVARSKDSGRGFDADFLVVDEAYDFTADQQDALAPTQMARPNAQTAYASSPPLKGDQSEALYRLRDRAEQRKGTKLGWRDWGREESLDEVLAMTDAERTAFLDDLKIAATCNPALGRGRVTAETIQNMRDAMTDAGYAREVYGCWPKPTGAGSAWKVITEAAWRARGELDDYDRPTGRVRLAIAASHPNAEVVSIALAGPRGHETLVQLREHRAGTAWVPDRVKELLKRHKLRSALLDRKGPAKALIPDLEDAGVKLDYPTADDVGQAAAWFYGAVAGDNPTLRHYDEPGLIAAVAAAQKREIGDGWTWVRRGVGDNGPLEAATLAAWSSAKHNSAPPPAPQTVRATTASAGLTGDLMQIGF